MEDFENLFIKIIQSVNPKVDLSKWEYQGELYDLSLPWPRISFEEAFAKYAGRNIEDVKDDDFYQIFFNEIGLLTSGIIRVILISWQQYYIKGKKRFWIT
jgi:lysyl-tRNA synthetase class II